MRVKVYLLVVLVCAVSGFGQTTLKRRTSKAVAAPAAMSANSAAKLPIRRVILYSNGVAYIERRGMVSGNAQINLPFKQSQVDDVLKSMVVLDLGQGHIGAVSYNSSAPIESRMSEIPFSVEAVSSDGGGIATVLSQLQGAKVAVTSAKGSAVGSILTVEKKQVKNDKESRTTSVLVIASENGEISSFDLNDVRSVKLLDDGTRRDLNEFASATASARRLDAKTITVTSEGTGQREMVVSYTTAAPIWKTTYRVVLDKEGKPFFQGWAIVDNVSDEDWNNVKLSLVSGSPVSFIQPLQKPLYRYRPVIDMPKDLKLQPQVYEPQGQGTGYGDGRGRGAGASEISGTVTDPNGAVIPGANVTITNTESGAAYATTTDNEGEFSKEGLTGINYSVSVDKAGFNRAVIQNVHPGRDLEIKLQVGAMSAMVTVQAESSMADTTSASVSSNLSNSETTVSDALLSNESGVQAAAVGEEVGDLFEYKIEQPVTVNRDRSALIPIIQTKMDGERVAIYNESVRQDRPFSGVLLKNGTDLTLESGSMTVLDGDAYAGEALMERLKPKEERLISFALDLGTHVNVRQKADRQPARIVKVVNGNLQVHYFQAEQRTYEISNQTDKPKTLYIEFPIRQGWQLTSETMKPYDTTQRAYRFRIELKPSENRQITIGLQQPLMDQYQIASLTRNDLDLFVSRRYIDDAARVKLEQIMDLRQKIADVDQKLEALDTEQRGIESDQKRYRENIESLSKTPEAKTLIERYIAKANDQETRLEEIEKQRKALEQEKETFENQLGTAIKTFEMKDLALN
ncbi:MAG TPA: carboxypeptidase regulatory-like domain-containing protein [Pyrinomonadaceae bacterium]|nr:carboxypeptidase regulatory-like domain-containing protein [Pyrinomonadaceae bacterium]